MLWAFSNDQLMFPDLLLIIGIVILGTWLLPNVLIGVKDKLFVLGMMFVVACYCNRLAVVLAYGWQVIDAKNGMELLYVAAAHTFIVPLSIVGCKVLADVVIDVRSGRRAKALLDVVALLVTLYSLYALLLPCAKFPLFVLPK